MSTSPWLPRLLFETLCKLRNSILKIVPDAEEVISYQIPTVKYKGKPLIAYAAYEKHCGLYTMSKDVIAALEKDLEAYDTSGVTIRFPVNKTLPAALLKKIIKARLQEMKPQ